MKVELLQTIANQLTLERLMRFIDQSFGGYKLLEHWTQGEFHHDLVFEVSDVETPILVVSTNCNGGVKDVMTFLDVPDRYALWNYRCPEESVFEGNVEPVLTARTVHWFEPCEVLAEDARSELKPGFRKRQFGGGWEPIG